MHASIVCKAGGGRNSLPCARRPAASAMLLAELVRASREMNGAEFLLGPQALARHGPRIALRCEDRAVRFDALAGEVQRAAGALVALGVKPGDRVLLLLRDTPEYAAAWLGAVRIGAVAIGLNTKLSEAEYRYILADSAARLAVIEDIFVAARPDLAAELAREGRLVIAGNGTPSWHRALASSEAVAAYPAQPQDPAFWLYSSGTTGKPKGIVHAHKDILPSGQVMHEVFGLGPGDTILTTSKLFFAYALEMGFLGALAIGATSILNPEWADAAPVAALVARHAPTAFFSVPSFYRRLLALPPERLAPFRAIRRFISAGERMPAPVLEQWQQATGREILGVYGMSETFCVCLATPPESTTALRTGRPLMGVDTKLLTPQGAEAAPGEPGVLWVRHPALALGYANLPEKTAAQFQDGWFCTNDIFVRDAAGCFTHQGRSDELVKIAGQYVQPGELEEAVSEEPSIGEAACTPVPDEDGFERLALFVTARGADDVAAAAAARACESRLPRHKRPKWIRVVAELPRTGTGKVQRFRLREMLEREFERKR
jgi:acyl-coenzyme A synthetase/AMP-(fatty) acid ligase